MLKKIFNSLRQLNRKRNYLTKDLKLLALSFKIKKSNLDSLIVKKITIQACKNGLGDAVIISGLPKILKNHGYHVTILTRTSNAFLFESNPYIDNIICIEKPLTKKKIEILKNLECDLFIDPNNKTSYSDWIFKIIRYIRPKHSIGINYPKIYRLYDTSLEYKDYTSHFSKRFIYILQKLNINITENEYKYDLHYPQEYDTQAEKFISLHKDKLICIFNPFASSERRSFSDCQTQEIVNLLSTYPNILTIVVGVLDKIKIIKESQNVLINPLSHFFYTLSLVKNSDLIISVDTSIVHVANAYNKQLISVYSSEIDGFDPHYKNNDVYQPNYNKAIQIIAPNNAAKNLKIDEIKDYLDKILVTLEKRNHIISV